MIDRRMKLSTTVIALTFTAIVVAGLRASPAESETGGYQFSNVQVVGQDSSHVTVEYDYSWAGIDFPGWRSCVWTVSASDGTLVAQKNVDLMGLQPSYGGKLIDIPVVAGADGSSPSTAEVTCNPLRLDQGDGRYEISDVQVRASSDFQLIADPLNYCSTANGLVQVWRE